MWELAAEPRLLAVWSLGRRRLGRTLVHVGVSPGHRLLGIFEQEGCRMVEMSCEEHDIQAASSQFITHTVGRMLGTMEMKETTINTKGYESLLSLVNNTYNDSFDLYYGLFMYNKNATQELNRLEAAFNEVWGAGGHACRRRSCSSAPPRLELRLPAAIRLRPPPPAIRLLPPPPPAPAAPARNIPGQPPAAAAASFG